MNWGVYGGDGTTPLPVQHLALNLGAPGDRRDGHGKLWLGYPRPASRAGIDLPLNIRAAVSQRRWRVCLERRKLHHLTGHDTPWIFASGLRGLTKLEIPVQAPKAAPATYTVKLMFAAPEGDTPGKRVFDVKLGDKVVLKAFDPATRKGAAVEVFEKVPASELLTVELIPSVGEPILNGIEILKTNAKEITQGVATR